MKKNSVKATILAKDNRLNISYSVCYLKQIYYEDDSFQYIFKPHYSVIDLPDHSIFQGIPGLNLDMKKESYIREKKIPTFIYERTPQKNREDLWELLDEVGLEYLDHLEWLIRTNKIYTGDHLTVEAYHSPRTYQEPAPVYHGDRFIINNIEDISGGNYKIIEFLLEIIIKGAFFESDGFVINNDNRSAMHKLLLPLYKNEIQSRRRKQQKGIQNARGQDKYTGRKKIDVSLPLLEEVIEKRGRDEISVHEAMKELNLTSRSTFYRRIRDFKSKV